MELNNSISEVLAHHNIDRSKGILCLLAIHYQLSPETIIPEDVLHAINQTKIVEKDYNTNTIKWNVPLFAGTEPTAFDWVKEWMDGFGKINPDRRGVLGYVTKRMKEFFASNPHIRKDDIIKATQLYFTSVSAPKYLMKSHKFIYDGNGTGNEKNSTLLQYCERVLAGQDSATNMKGKIVS